jgi:hypothetical protein
MNRRRTILGLILVPFLICASGCGSSGNSNSNTNLTQIISQNKQNILAALKIAAKEGTARGLKEWAKTKPDAAKEAAAALARNIDQELLPYFNGEAALQTSAQVQEFISSSLFKNVPDEIKDAVMAAAVVLDIYLPIPGSEKLKQDHLDYIVAFLEGVRDGSLKFDSAKEQRRWIK